MDFVSYPIHFECKILTALNAELLAIAYCTEGHLIEIVTINRATGDSHTLKTSLVGYISCSSRFQIGFFREDLIICVNLDRAAYYRHHVCSREFLPYPQSPRPLPSFCSVTTSTIHRQVCEGIYYTVQDICISPVTGILVELSETYPHFELEDPTAPGNIGISILVCNPHTGASKRFTPAQLTPYSLYINNYNRVSPASIWSTTFITTDRQSLRLHLLRYDPEDLHTSFRPLFLPAGINLDQCLTFDIDDGRCEIVMSTDRSTISRLSYADQ